VTFRERKSVQVIPRNSRHHSWSDTHQAVRNALPRRGEKLRISPCPI